MKFHVRRKDGSYSDLFIVVRLSNMRMFAEIASKTANIPQLPDQMAGHYLPLCNGHL
jgi:hypothetical protein